LARETPPILISFIDMLMPTLRVYLMVNTMNQTITQWIWCLLYPPCSAKTRSTLTEQKLFTNH